MEKIENLRESHFHHLYTKKCVRFKYSKDDFSDYVLMSVISAVIMGACFGWTHPFAIFCSVLCAIMVVLFSIRHGYSIKFPVLLKEPHEIFFMFLYKIQNLKSVYFLAVGLLLLENLLIYLTPTWPHHTELMREIGYVLFWAHFGIITAYRTYMLIDHLKKDDIVKEVLMKTVWRSMLSKEPNIKLQVWHAYFTGILSHALMIAPWYLVITYFNFSVLFLVPAVILNTILNKKFLVIINEWFYRDHWVGHHLEVDFLYLHGPHHDAIPSGLIGVGGNGYLEGFLRYVIGVPTPFFNPFTAAFFSTIDVHQDIITHQYIPGVFPYLSKSFNTIQQHSTHHFGRLQPYGFALNFEQDGVSEQFKAQFNNLPEEFINSYKLDEKLNGFKWDNPKHKKYLELVDKYTVNRAQANAVKD